MNRTNVLIRHGYVNIADCKSEAGPEHLATVMMNLSYYGFAVNQKAYQVLSHMDAITLASWWADMETELKIITGDNRKIADFVVYKNFPAEVLDKTEAEYWIPQLLMYWGFPKEFFTEPVAVRAKMDEQPKAKLLKLSNDDSLNDILVSYLKAPARWKDEEWTDVAFLMDQFPIQVSKIAFKENLVRAAVECMDQAKPISITTATDVLRLAAGLSDGDLSLREKFKFKSFSKPARKFLLGLLEKCSNLSEDLARHPELWKRLIHQLHPGDYKVRFPKVYQAMDDLYQDRLVTFNSRVEVLLSNRDAEVLTLLASRPGDFRRRLTHTLDLFGALAAGAFIHPDVLDRLTTFQVVALRTHLEMVNLRDQRTFPPRGNWSKLQLGTARPIKEEYVQLLSDALGKILAARMPKVKVLDLQTNWVKLPNNGEVGPYTRGTTFPIPDEVDFIRSASYWQNEGVVWFDNGWNFFSDDWKSLGACCWTAPFGEGAIFSGDPINSKEMEGKGAQLIDLYPSKLVKQGVRYAVWNVLCYSKVPFSKAKDVFAALQWGKDAQEGGLFEPSRCQLAFPLTGESMTKYVCLVDLKKRQMVYLDANLHGTVHSAAQNGPSLEKNLPPFMEYLDSLPSVYDLFRSSKDESSDLQVLYSDQGVDIQADKAYVFRPENKNNNFKPVDINALLA